MSNRSRARLVVIQVLVLSLFATLFVRLWYLQVVSGETFGAQAEANYVREVEIPAQRGLILDAMGRPLVANRTSIVVTVDRNVLARMPDAEVEAVLRRVGEIVGLPYEEIVASTRFCGEAGAEPPPVCWNGSRYQPIPVAEDVPPEVALAIMERAEDFPGVTAEHTQVRAYPEPFGVNAAHLLGYLSPITEDELDQAEADGDETLHRRSTVGRSGLERFYDRFLRGIPGQQLLAVDSMGRVIESEGQIASTPGAHLVTSIDARVQSVVEQQLAETIERARQTVDPVTGRPYEADAGAVVVMDTSGRVVAMASAPTYDPEVWVGGISPQDFEALNSEENDIPLLSRATQGQYAPGSTWKPIMTTGALMSGYDFDTRLNCSSSFSVGNGTWLNYESGSYGPIGFAKALQVSCNTFFYRIGYQTWVDSGADPDDVNAVDPLVEIAQAYGFGEATGVDLPAEANGRIADREWRLEYWESLRDYYCDIAEQPDASLYAREFCEIGYQYRASDAVNYVIGQGDTIVTPLQLARAYSALANGGTLYEPTLGRAVVSPTGEVLEEIAPEVAGQVPATPEVMEFIDEALTGTTLTGTTAWRFGGFPLDEIQVRSKTGSAEVDGKQTTSWLASYTDEYVVVMMVSQGGTGSGTSGPAVREIFETLYGVNDAGEIDPGMAAQPGARTPDELPVIEPTGEVRPPAGLEDALGFAASPLPPARPADEDEED